MLALAVWLVPSQLILGPLLVHFVMLVHIPLLSRPLLRLPVFLADLEPIRQRLVQALLNIVLIVAQVDTRAH
jgi:hypothetical protein